jgi:hypothetical protein
MKKLSQQTHSAIETAKSEASKVEISDLKRTLLRDAIDNLRKVLSVIEILQRIEPD